MMPSVVSSSRWQDADILFIHATCFEDQMLQAFATAFQNGDWLLLDEMNLAQDTVLQCIEQALDSGQLIVNDLSGGGGSAEEAAR